MTDPNGRILRSGFEARAPRPAIEFAEHYNRSDIAQGNLDDIKSYKNEFPLAIGHWLTKEGPSAQLVPCWKKPCQC